MNFKEYKEFVAQITTGKQLPDAVYLHVTALSDVPEKLSKTTKKIANALSISNDAWNVIKFNKRDFKLSLLYYPSFDTYAYPALEHSYTIDLSKLTVRQASYKESPNPPILHRKETFIRNS